MLLCFMIERQVLHELLQNKYAVELKAAEAPSASVSHNTTRKHEHADKTRALTFRWFKMHDETINQIYEVGV